MNDTAARRYTGDETWRHTGDEQEEESPMSLGSRVHGGGSAVSSLMLEQLLL